MWAASVLVNSENTWILCLPEAYQPSPEKWPATFHALFLPCFQHPRGFPVWGRKDVERIEQLRSSVWGTVTWKTDNLGRCSTGPSQSQPCKLDERQFEDNMQKKTCKHQSFHLKNKRAGLEKPYTKHIVLSPLSFLNVGVKYNKEQKRLAFIGWMWLNRGGSYTLESLRLRPIFEPPR